MAHHYDPGFLDIMVVLYLWCNSQFFFIFEAEYGIIRIIGTFGMLAEWEGCFRIAAGVGRQLSGTAQAHGTPTVYKSMW